MLIAHRHCPYHPQLRPCTHRHRSTQYRLWIITAQRQPYNTLCTAQSQKNKLFNHTSDTIINQTQLSFNEIERHYNFHYSQQSIIIWHTKIFMKTLANNCAECNHFQFKQWCTLPLQAHQDCLHGWSGGSTFYTHLGLLRTLWFYGPFIAFMTMFGTVCIVWSRVHKTVCCHSICPIDRPQQWRAAGLFLRALRRQLSIDIGSSVSFLLLLLLVSF